MPQTLEQFAKSLASSGLMTAEEIKSFHAALPAEKRKDVPHFATELVRSGKITRYQAASIYQGGSLNLVMGDYRILDKIGAGGMGQVFKAEHRRMKRVVALKLLPADVTKDVHALKRFQREVETAARLIHPNIVTAYDAGEHQGVHYLIMEFVDGQDLSSLVKKQGTLPIDTAVNFAAQAARGLEHAHAEGVIHRDIKPANLLVDKKGTIKILDMGLARIDDSLSSREKAESDEGLTNSGVMMGTVDYMSPEQSIDTHQADHRADVYSLGCTLFYLLTGRRMFEGETLMKRILAHRDLPPPSLAGLRPDMSADLEAIFQKMVAKLPVDRYGTMTDCRIALEDCLARLESDGDSSVLQFDKVVDEDLASFLKGMKAQAAAGTLAPPRIATETIGNRQELETRPDSRSHTTGKRKPWPYAGVAACFALAAGLAAAVVMLNRSAEDLPKTQTPPGAVAQADSNSSSEPKPAELEPVMPQVEPRKPIDFRFGDGARKRGRRPEPALAPEQPEKSSETPEREPEKPSQPAKPTESAGPKTIIVGKGTGELSDLTDAIEKARAGDTILIRHRGPLALAISDLAGKSPLTIVGDAIDGVDVWPLIVQGASKQPKSPNEAAEVAPGFLNAEQMDLTLRKLHLAAGGPASKSERIGSIFSMRRGTLLLEDCSITLGSEGSTAEPIRDLLPLVRTSAGPNDPVHVSLLRTYVRGGRLAECISAVGAGEIVVDAEQLLWAGSPSAWIAATDVRGPLTVNLSRATIYNGSSLLRWDLASSPPGQPLVKLAVSQSLLVGAYANKDPLLAWNSADGLADVSKAASEGILSWKGDGNVYHRFAGYYREPRVKQFASLTKWRTLWGQTGPTVDREADPHFRVWTTGYLLQEAATWDYEPRFFRNREKSRQIAEPVGANIDLLPSGLVRSFDRRPTPDMASRPRGVPRILRVHSREGPHKTIEEALAEARDGDIVEIADNGPYTPKRNFAINPGDGVLESKVDSLTIRASRDATPVLLFRDDVQEGALTSSWMGAYPAFVAVQGRTSLTIDGLHFRMLGTSAAKHRTTLALQDVPLLRISNCSFNVPLPNSAVYLASLPSILWMENCGVFNLSSKNEDELIRFHSKPQFDQNAVLINVHNCLFNSTSFGYRVERSGAQRSSRLSLHNNTFLGRIGNWWSLGALTADCSENLVSSSEAVFKFDDDNTWRTAIKQGDRNALWIGTRPLTDAERLDFGNALLPGPVLKSPPVFETPTLAREALRRFRPKKTSVTAADGANVGVRFEYLPDIPTE